MRELSKNEFVEILNNSAKQTPIEIALQINDDGTVSARNVFKFLGMDFKNYARWCRMNITENQFAEENADFTPFVMHEEWGGRATTDYRLTVPFAKKLCMIQKNERGEQARDYFIQVEETLKTVAQKIISHKYRKLN